MWTIEQLVFEGQTLLLVEKNHSSKIVIHFICFNLQLRVVVQFKLDSIRMCTKFVLTRRERKSDEWPNGLLFFCNCNELFVMNLQHFRSICISWNEVHKTRHQQKKKLNFVVNRYVYVYNQVRVKTKNHLTTKNMFKRKHLFSFLCTYFKLDC